MNTTFGPSGTGTVIYNAGSSNDQAEDVIVQPDGKIVAAGGPGFTLVRYNADGTLDASFGTGGKATAGLSTDTCYAIARQADGKLVAAGGPDFKLVRLNADGTLDTTFGSGGVVNSALGGKHTAFDVAIRSDGKIIAVGNNSKDIVIARYLANGQLDTGFSGNGSTSIDLGGFADYGRAVSIQSDNKLLITGRTELSATDSALFVMRTTAGGNLDSTFGTGGIVKTNLTTNVEDVGSDVTLQPDGKVVVAGRRGDDPNADLVVLRYTSSGVLDASFGTGGYTTVDFAGGRDLGKAVRVLPDGKLLVAGRATLGTSGNNQAMALVRFNANGTLDGSFGVGGKVTTDLTTGRDYANAMALTAEGDVILAGSAGDNDFAIAKYHLETSATLSLAVAGSGFQTSVSFGPDGSAAVPGYRTDLGNSYALRSNGRTFGWIDAATGSPVTNSGSTFKRNGVADQLRDTGIKTDGKSWEMLVPNGDYYVTLVAGDANVTSGTYGYDVEGASFLSGTAGAGDARWVTRSGVVHVTDGRLTISNAAGATNHALAYVEITDQAARSRNAVAAPDAVVATAANATTVDVRWTDKSDNETAFRVERATDPNGGAWALLGMTVANAGVFTDTTAAANTTYFYRVTAAKGTLISAPVVSNALTTPGVNPGQLPYNVARAPWSTGTAGTAIEAENFDAGGSGVSYSDVTAGNAGGYYRSGDGDVGYNVTNGRYFVGWNRANEWYEYTIDVPASGTYAFQASVASDGPGGNFSVGVLPPGGSLTTKASGIQIPDTGDFTNYQEITTGTFTLAAGTQVLRITSTNDDPTGYWVGDIDWFKLAPVSTTPPVVAITASVPTATEAGPTNGRFTVTRTGPTDQALTVNYALSASGTATSGTDFAALTGTVTFGVGASSATIDVVPVDDAVAESDETVIVTLSPSANGSYTLGTTTSATVTIQDNDGSGVQPTVTVAGASQVDEGATYTLNWSIANLGQQETITGWQVNWGDGQSSGVLAATANSATHTYGDGPGTFTPVVTAIRGGGGTYAGPGPAVTVANVAPTVTIAGPASGSVNANASFSVVTLTDPSPADQTGAFGYAWSVTKDGAAYAPGTPANQSSFVFAPGVAGTYVVVLTVTDKDNGSRASNAVTLTVGTPSNHPPTVAQPIPDQSATQSTAFGYTVPAGAFVDVDAGDTLTYVATRGDGTSLPAWLSFDAPSRTFQGTPGAGDVGTLTIRVTATDLSNVSAVDTFDLTVAASGTPFKPGDVRAIGVSPTQVLLTWADRSGDETGFFVERATDAAFTQDLTSLTPTATNATALTDGGLTPGTTYYYRVSAIGSTAGTGVSNSASATTLAAGAATVSVVPAMAGDPRANTVGDAAFGTDGGGAAEASYSGGAVRYHDGREFHSATDLAPAEAGVVSGLTRTWSSDPLVQAASTLVGMGAGWVLSQLPTLVRPAGDADTVAVVDGGRSVRFFDLIDGIWKGRFNTLDTLAGGSSEGFTLTDTAGDVTSFGGFGSSALASGATRYVDAGGNETTYDYGGGKIAQIERKRGSGPSATVLERLAFTAGSGSLTVAMSRLNEASATLQAVRQAVYTIAGGLLSAVNVKTTAGVDVDRKHYRYDTGQRLTVVLEGASLERAAAALGDPAAVGSADALRPYADLFFAYDSAGRLTKQQMRGAGTYQYAYVANRSASGLNEWAYKTIEYVPDASGGDSWNDANLADNDRNEVYSNYAGEVVASTFVDEGGTAADKGWTTAYRYDADGRVTLTATPAAVDASLLNSANADVVLPALRGSGLVHVNAYYPASSPASGYLQSTAVQNGTDVSSRVTRASYEYGTTRPNSGGRLLTASTAFRSDGGDPSRTEFAYAFYSGNDQVRTITTTLPAVSVSENGDGSATQEQTVLDAFGRPIWTRDGDGYLTRMVYDDATGALVQTVIDAAQASGSPTRTGAGSPLAIATATQVDRLGRPTQITDPRGKVTVIAYTDAAAYDEIRTTPPATSGSGAPTPETIVRQNYAAKTVETIRLVRGTNQITALSRDMLNDEGQLVSSDRYESTDGMTYTTSGGVSGTGAFYRDTFTYDDRGRRVTAAAGRDFNGVNPTVTQTVYDDLDRPIETWVGTDPSVAGNMTKTASFVYDGGDVGNGNLTQSTRYVDGTAANDRVTVNAYDWRDRLVAIKAGAQPGESADVNRPISYVKYDNLDRAVITYVFDGDGITLADADGNGVPDMPAAAKMRSATLAQYDARGRAYRTTSFSVDPSNGASGGIYSNTAAQFASLTDGQIANLGGVRTNVWFDGRGQAVKTKAPGGLVTKSTYDGAGRTTRQATTDGGGDATLADARTLDGDAVLEQADYAFDADGNATLVTTSQRRHDATTTGPLTATTARVSFVGNWYDDAGRLATTVNWGNNGGTAITSRPSTPPARAASDGWDPYLRTDQKYDESGRVQDVTSPRGIVTRQSYDALDRPTIKYEAYQNAIAGDTPDKDDDRKTQRHYNGFDQVVSEESQTFGQAAGGTLQIRTFITDYTYGVTKSGGSAVNDSGLLGSIGHSRVANGTPVSTETFTKYNAAGENTQKTQQNGSVHDYSYDALGRLTSDEFTNANARPNTMEKDARKLTFQYDVFGRGTKFTTDGYLPNGTSFQVLNQVERAFDGLGNLVTEWQDHDGVVVKSGTNASFSVRYTYDTNFGANYTRQSSLVYPDGRKLWTGYDDTTLNAAISRPGYLADSNYDASGNATTPKSTKVEDYEYLGLSRVIRRDQPEGGEGLGYTADDILFTPDRDDAGASDPYDGLDRFGRVVSHGWDSFNARSYAYDADGNLLSAYAGNNVDTKWRSDLFQADGVTANQAYDKLGRLKTYQRGILDDAVTDSNGRYDTADTSTTIRPIGIPSWYVPQGGARSTIETHYRNQQWETSTQTNGFYDRKQDVNEIDDPANRKTFQRRVPIGTISRPDDPDETTDVFAQFDAWGRLGYKGTATVQDIATFGSDHTYDPTADKPKDEQTFVYDALGRRITESRRVATGPTTSTFRGTSHLFYDAAGNVIEERKQAVEANPSTVVQYQYVRSLAGLNLIVTRDGQDGSGGPYGDPDSNLTERLWVQQGPDGSVWQIEDADGGPRDVVQYLYTPEGQVLVIKPQLKTYTYYDTILDEYQQITSTWYETPNGNEDFAAYDFRYLWKGQRAEVHAAPSDASGNIIDHYDGLYWTGNGEHDSHRGGPLDEDVSAYSRPAGDYDEWTPTSTNYPSNGTSGQWASPGSFAHAWMYGNTYGAMGEVTTPAWMNVAATAGWAGLIAGSAALTGGLSLTVFGAAAATAAGATLAGAGVGAGVGAGYAGLSGGDVSESAAAGAEWGSFAGGFYGTGASKAAGSALRWAFANPVRGTAIAFGTTLISPQAADGGIERLVTSFASKSAKRTMPMAARAAQREIQLAAAGEDLFVGGFGVSSSANRASGLNITHTAHHAVQNAVSPTTLSRGITINLRKVGIHDATRTFRRAFSQVSGGLRGHLAADVRDLRGLLNQAGYPRQTINAQLLELTRQNKVLWNKMNLSAEAVWGR